MPKNIVQIIMRNLYIIGSSRKQYTQHHIKAEGQIWYLQYLLIQLMIKTNAPDPLWDFYKVTES